MDGANLSYFIDLYSNVDVFLLIFLRLLGFFVILPIFTSGSIPIQVKVIFVAAFAYIIFYSNIITGVTYSNSILGYGFLMIKEFIVGVCLGYVVFAFFSLLYLTGHLIDYQLGFTMLSILDPISQIQVPITGNLYYMAVTAFLVQTGGLNQMISALFYSYSAIPIGEANLFFNANLLAVIIELLGKFFEIGVRFSMPIMGTILIVNVSLGLITRAAPNLHVFSIGMPIKNIGGLILLLITAPLLVDFYNVVYNESYNFILKMIGSFSP